MLTSDVVQWAWEALEPRLADQGYELVEAELAQQGGSRVLRLFIDRPGGITLEHCQAVSHLVSPLLDTAFPGRPEYLLEVSSPGVARPVRKWQDFERFTGEGIRVKTHRPIDGRRRFTGVLKSCRDGVVTVECDGRPFAIPMDTVHKATLDR